MARTNSEKILRSKTVAIAEIDKLAQNAVRLHLARQMAPMLIRIVGIRPNGIDLVLWLAGPACRDNLEATVHWIVAQFSDPTFGSPDRPTSMFDQLVSRMTRQLAKVEGSYTCH